MKRSARLIVTLLGLLVPLAAQAASELRVLARSTYVSRDLLQKFERETGVSVTLSTLSTQDEMIGKLSDGHSGFDITFPADNQVAKLIENGLIERVLADRLPGFWNIEDPWRSRSFDPRNEYTIPHQWGTTAFAVDTSIHRGDIDSLRLLFDPPPEIQGRIALLDSPDVMQLALLYLGEPRCTVDKAKLARVDTILLPLLARARLTAVERALTTLDDPTIALAVAWNGDVMRARESRPSLAYAYPREGNLVWTDVIAVPRNPPNRANALKFLAFMLKPENAAQASNFNGYANMIRGSEAHMAPHLLAAPELVAPWPAKVGFSVSCNAEVQRIHDEMWIQLKKRAILLPVTIPRG
ncbi:Spermidine/putrescine-binding periplasmic protein [Candidatus Terasakiella magnetica]|nr:Spermidine/putrescine-binding periplasmic protein [Candidatus Terasakiella magnetica]